MPEDFENDNDNENIDWERYLGAARRRTWHFLLPFFLVWLIVWVASWFMPSVYRSGTLILVEQPSVPASLVPSNISDNLQQRLDSIRQQILSRTRLLHIINQFNLYSDGRVHVSQDQLVERMSKDIEIDLVRSPDQENLTSFNVYYFSRDPHLAQQVTSELTNLFITANLEDRQRQSENTTNFLEQQVEQAAKDLAAQEQKVSQFKEQHIGELPGQLQSNLEILHGMQSQLQNEQNALSNAREHNVYLQSLVSQYQNARAAKSATTGTGDVVPLGLPAIDQELDRLRSELADLKSRYTDQYPDVRKVKEQINNTLKMKQQIEAEMKAAAFKPSTATAPTDEADIKADSPTLELQSQLKANQVEIANRERNINSLQAQIVQYQARLNDSPLREQQLTELMRGYDQSKADYDSLLKRKNESELATNLEHQQQGEHFSVLDPPNLPATPTSPNRLKLFGIGLGAGLVLGGVVAGGAEFLDDRVYTEAELKKLIPAEVIVEIPAIVTPAEQTRQARELRVRITAAAAVVLVIVVALGFTYLRL